MAARRPASRPRLNSVGIPAPTIPRSRSALARPVASRESEAPSIPSASSSLQRSQDSQETNIQVVLRCRSRSEREKDENSSSVVHIEGPTTKELTIETSAPVSSLGVVTLAPTRTYPFDLVFGPEATQSMIYHDVVSPMLAEVLTGYNCTLFAYGQTGTGKTYTMQGDLTPTPMGNPSPNAGIIPRVLFRLFHELEKTCSDFVVKVSYMELYNEELRDLLAPDLCAPTSLTQPMAMAAKDAKSGERELKIFDDANKRGVVIQGLEEVAVKDSNHALVLLTKGSERRQIAATKFNDHSSRSHSIFCITVHMKHKSSIGEDLLRIGKLNLVDLAGSENIGRSGAENKRAREAGMINQSLLTLGRVINALVDKAQHVPYRESKLTRLLQDSLGGRTKTCIIATISPARCNTEETLSTLDYALRAKSIRNKPELNQRMTRNALLKEYVAEIERLKADLLAAREMNGIFVSEERWNEMNTEAERRETELSEATKRFKIIEDQMRNVRDELDQSIAILKKRDEDLQDSRQKLDKTEKVLKLREGELQQMTTMYEEEVVIRRAHAASENVIDGVATGLKNVTTESLRDLDGLFKKLERKGTVLSRNNSVAAEAGKLVQAYSQSLAEKLAESHQATLKTVSKLENESKKFQSTEQAALSEQGKKVEEHFKQAKELFHRLKSQTAVEDQAVAELGKELEDTRQSLLTTVSSWSKEFQSSCKRLCDETRQSTNEQTAVLEEAISTMQTIFKSSVDDTLAFIESQKSTLQEIRSSSHSTLTQEITRLKSQNQILAELLVNERKAADKAKDELVARISSMLGDFVQKRDESLRSSVSNLQQSNQEVEALLAATCSKQVKSIDAATQQGVQFQSSLAAKIKEDDDAADQAYEASSQVANAIESGLTQMRKTVSSSVTTHTTWVQQRSQAMGETSTRSMDGYSRAKRARLEASSALYTVTEASRQAQSEYLSASGGRMETFAGHMITGGKTLAQSTRSHQQALSQEIQTIHRAASHLVHDGIKDDLPTGETPRKRKWQYPTDWTVTESREAVLDSWRQQRSEEQPESASEPSSSSKQFVGDEVEEMVEEPPAAEPPKKIVAVEAPPPPAVAAVSEPLVDSRRRNHVGSRITRRAR